MTALPRTWIHGDKNAWENGNYCNDHRRRITLYHPSLHLPVRLFVLFCLFTSACLPFVLVQPASAAMSSISPCPSPAQDEMSQLYIDAVRSRGADGSCDANCERLYAQMERQACEYAASGTCYSCDPAVCAKYGITCRNSPPVTQPPPEEPFPWMVVVGGLAAVAIAAVAAAKLLGKKAPEEKEKKKQKAVRYILQISPTDTIEVSTKEPGSFTAAAWKVDENGALSRADDASISVTPPESIPGLVVTPLSGTGSVTPQVSLGQPAGSKSAKIQVTASVEGNGISTFVTLNFETETNIEFD
jgi:hypothetical protein